MTRPWNVVMAWVMEHCDDKGMKLWDEKAMERSDDMHHGAL